MAQIEPYDDNSSDNHDEVQYLEHPAGIVEQVDVQNVTGEPKKEEIIQPPTAATTAERLSDSASFQSSSPLPQETVSSTLTPPSPTRSSHTTETSLSRRRSVTDVGRIFALYVFSNLSPSQDLQEDFLGSSII